MSKFIAFIACQLGVYGEYLDSLDHEARAN